MTKPVMRQVREGVWQKMHSYMLCRCTTEPPRKQVAFAVSHPLRRRMRDTFTRPLHWRAVEGFFPDASH